MSSERTLEVLHTLRGAEQAKTQNSLIAAERAQRRRDEQHKLASRRANQYRRQTQRALERSPADNVAALQQQEQYREVRDSEQRRLDAQVAAAWADRQRAETLLQGSRQLAGRALAEHQVVERQRARDAASRAEAHAERAERADSAD